MTIRRAILVGIILAVGAVGGLYLFGSDKDTTATILVTVPLDDSLLQSSIETTFDHASEETAYVLALRTSSDTYTIEDFTRLTGGEKIRFVKMQNPSVIGFIPPVEPVILAFEQDAYGELTSIGRSKGRYVFGDDEIPSGATVVDSEVYFQMVYTYPL